MLLPDLFSLQSVSNIQSIKIIVGEEKNKSMTLFWFWFRLTGQDSFFRLKLVGGNVAPCLLDV